MSPFETQCDGCLGFRQLTKIIGATFCPNVCTLESLFQQDCSSTCPTLLGASPTISDYLTSPTELFASELPKITEQDQTQAYGQPK